MNISMAGAGGPYIFMCKKFPGVSLITQLYIHHSLSIPYKQCHSLHGSTEYSSINSLRAVAPHTCYIMHMHMLHAHVHEHHI